MEPAMPASHPAEPDHIQTARLLMAQLRDLLPTIPASDGVRTALLNRDLARHIDHFPMEPAMPTPTDHLPPDLAAAVEDYTRGVERISAPQALRMMGETIDDLKKALAHRAAENDALLRHIATLTLPLGWTVGQIAVSSQTYLVWVGDDNEFRGTRVYPHTDF
jgi:hypothetical protein